MRISYLAFLFLFMLPSSASGQKTYSLADTVITNRLIQESSDIIYAGNYIGNLNSDKNFDLGYNKIDSALLMGEQIWGQESKEVGQILGIKIDFLIFFYKKYDEALIIAEKILAIRLKAFGEISTPTAYAYTNFANCYVGKMLTQKAIDAYKKEIEILEKIQPLDERRIADENCTIAGIYAKTDELVKTCFYYEKAEKSYAKILGETDPLTLHISIHLAKYYNDNFEYDKASQKLNVMQQRIQKLSGTEKLQAELNVTMQHLNIAYNTGNLDKAFHYLTLIENGRQQLNLGQNHLYSLYGYYYAEKGDFDKALDYAYKNLDVALKQSYLFPKLEAYWALAEIYFLKEDYSNGLKYCQIGLDSSKSLTSKICFLPTKLCYLIL